MIAKQDETLTPTLKAAETVERMRQSRIRHLMVKDRRTIVRGLDRSTQPERLSLHDRVPQRRRFAAAW